MFSVQHNIASARRSLRRLRDVQAKADMAAQNKTAAKMRTAVRGALAKDIRVKVGEVKRRFVLRRATKTGGAALTILVARGVDAGKVRGVRDRRPGGVTVPGAKGATRHPHAFIPRGGRRVFERRGKARLPLRTVTVPIREPAQRLGRQWLARSGRSEYRRILRREFEFRARRALANP